MSTYKELLAQREQLEQQIAEVRKAELAGAVAQVRTLIAEFGLTKDDVFPTSRRSSQAGTKVAPKYRDPATGRTWSGRGKAPKWLSDLPEDQRQSFLIAE
ncbi:H-NS histone family protein [Comamonas sp. w2-DMI]|uniref:H-NS histone family protein n=1 Tax=Comamonas sp. w2-DMI TaxID=3126391 RepID=UPI0032E458BB